MISLLKASLLSLHKTYRQYLLLGAISVMIAGFAFVPAIAWVFNRLLRVFGSGYLLNSDLIRLVFDVRSMLVFVAMLLLIVMAIFIELAIIIVIAREAYHNRRVPLADAFSTAWRRIPRILGFGVVHLMLLLIILSPLIENPLSDYLLGSLNIPILIRTEVLTSRLTVFLYAVLVLIILYWMLRSIFSLHFIVLTDQPMRRAIRYSFIMTRRRQYHTLLYMIIFNLVTVVLALFLFSSLNRLPGLIGLRFKVTLIENIMMLISSYLTFLSTLLLVPVNMIMLTRLFYRYQTPETPTDFDFQVRDNRWVGKLEQTISRRLHGRRFLVQITLSICLVLTFLLNFNLYQQASYLRWNVLVISHRGDLASAPENSLNGIQSAIDKSVDLIEVDVMLTADGVPVLHHDSTLRRLAGRPERIADLTFAELQEIDIGSRFDSSFAGVTVPSLEQAIHLMLFQDSTSSQLLLDLKPDQRWSELADAVVRLIEEYELVENCYVQSFNPVILQSIRQQNVNIRLGQILTWAVGDLSALDVDFYAINKAMVSDDFIRQARRQDRQVWVWTVNDEQSMRAILRYDIDGIITDYPERLQSLVAMPAVPEAFFQSDQEMSGSTDEDQAE